MTIPKYSFEQLLKIKDVFDRLHASNYNIFTYIAPEDLDQFGKYLIMYNQNYKSVDQLVDNSFAKEVIKNMDNVNLFFGKPEDVDTRLNKIILRKYLSAFINDNLIEFQFEDYI